MKQIVSIGELALKLVKHLSADRVAAAPNARANRRQEPRRIAAEMHAHHPYAVFDDARQRAAPTRVKRTHRLTDRIGDKYWQAISGLHTEQQSGTVGYQAVAGQRLRRRPLN